MAARPNQRSLHDSAIETLASASDLPREVVADLYRSELANFESTATIKQFLPLIVSRRVIQQLRLRGAMH